MLLIDTHRLIAPTPECARILHDVLRGPSPNDSTSLPSPKAPAPNSTQPLSKYTFGLPTSYSVPECHPDIVSSWNSTSTLLQSLGATVTPLVSEFTTIQSSLDAYYMIACAEASSNLARYDGIKYGSRDLNSRMNYDVEYGGRFSLFGEEVRWRDSRRNEPRKCFVKRRPNLAGHRLLDTHVARRSVSLICAQVRRRIDIGVEVLSREGTQYDKAMQIRNQLRSEYQAALTSHDALLLPTSVTPPITLDGNEHQLDQNVMRANDLMTVGASLAGFPAISIPAGPDSKFWAGMQLVCNHGEDDKLLSMALQLHEAIQKQQQ